MITMLEYSPEEIDFIYSAIEKSVESGNPIKGMSRIAEFIKPGDFCCTGISANGMVFEFIGLRWIDREIYTCSLQSYVDKRHPNPLWRPVFSVNDRDRSESSGRLDMIKKENRYINTDKKWVEKADIDLAEDKTDTKELKRIIDIVGAYYGTTTEELMSLKRDSKLVIPRQIAIFLCLDREDTTYEKLSEFMIRKKSTIMLAEKKVWELLEKSNKMITEDLKNLSDMIDHEIYEEEI